nr:MAG TPA: hypothetical protein [Caudoviricetes sp.]
MFKCELLIGGKTYDTTNDLKNWDDFELLQKRPAYDGVVRSFSTQFEFVKKAYKLLKNEFYTNYLNAEATVIFSLRNNNWEYDEVFRCALDFSTYSEDGLIASINAIDNTLAAIIKAKKNIQYEYPVADLYTRSLVYDRLKMQNRFNFTMSDHFIVNPLELANVYISSYGNEVSQSGFIEPDTGEKGEVAKLENVPESGIDVVVDMDVEYENSGVGQYANFTISSCGKTDRVSINRGESKNIKLKIKVNKSDFDSFSQVKRIYFSIELIASQTTYANIYIKKINEFTAVYYSIGESVDIDVISPIEFLDKLLASMSETTDTYYGVIDDYDPRMILDRLSTVYIMAAESARGLPKAKIYTSYKKYCDWMEAEFGYVPVISGNEVTFIHRDKLFTNTVVKELGKRINDYELTVNDGLVYSSVKVGYDKQDYDSINGRDEFRFTNEFSTGLKLLDNTLSLISPYRADAYGIEFLVQKRGEDTTDSDSDNDVFFVSCDLDGVNLKLYRPYSAAQLSGLLSPETMFNLDYSPRFMLEANKKYIGACTNLLKFASSDGNSDVSINGVKETDDFPILERLFTVSEVEVSTSDIKAPADLTGLVSFNNKGEIITGYIKQLELNIAKEKAATYTLIVKDIKS